MKLAGFTSLLLVVASPVIAQEAPAPATAPAADAKLSIESPIAALVENAATKAVIDTNFPGMTAHPAFEQFKVMSLKELQPLSGGVITDEAIAKAATELAAIK